MPNTVAALVPCLMVPLFITRANRSRERLSAYSSRKNEAS